MSYTKHETAEVKVYQGDAEPITINVTSAGAAYSLTGYTIRAQARTNPDSGDVLFDTSSTTGMAITNGVNGTVLASGIVVLLIPAAVTATLPAVCYCDVTATSGSTVTRVARIKLIVTKNFTR